jgi:thioredoxin reductase
VEEAIELAEHASEVTLIASEPVTATEHRLAALKGHGNVTVLAGKIVALNGGGSLEGILVSGVGGELPVSANGLFLQVGRVPARDFLPEDVAASGGVFLAGDVRQDAGRTITEAIADGAKAGHNAIEWVRAQKGA